MSRLAAVAASRDSMLPHSARIARVANESEDTRTFVLRLAAPVPALDQARPGQFVMLSLLGHGEAAFTLAELPACGAEPGTVTLTVRRVGALTSALFGLGPGARLGVRGPYGRGFPADVDRPTVYVGGGCGLVPLRSAIDDQIARRPPGTAVAVVYGARTPASRVLRGALAGWARTPGVTVIETVEVPDRSWRGRVGATIDVVDEALRAVGATPGAVGTSEGAVGTSEGAVGTSEGAVGTSEGAVGASEGALGAMRAAVCGPPAMLGPVAARLRRAGVAADSVFVALERYMKCGTGLCGHCYVNHRYLCTDGPVFSLAELADLPDALDPSEDSHC